MNRTVLTFRLVLAWLLLLALPLQGMANTRLTAGATAHAAANVSTTHAGPALTQAPPHCAMQQHDVGGVHEGKPDSKHDSKHPGKHGACAFCCVGAAMAPAVLPRLVLARPGAVAVPFYAPHLPSGLPVLPDRPPRPVLA